MKMEAKETCEYREYSDHTIATEKFKRIRNEENIPIGLRSHLIFSVSFISRAFKNARVTRALENTVKVTEIDLCDSNPKLTFLTL